MGGDGHEAFGQRRAFGREADLQTALIGLRPFAKDDAVAMHVGDQARQRRHFRRRQRREFAEPERMPLFRQRGNHAIHRQRQPLLADDADKEVAHAHAEAGKKIRQRI